MRRNLPNRPKKKFEHQIYAYYEGEQEKAYFNHLKTLINNEPECNIKRKLTIVPKDCGGGDPRNPVQTAIKNCNFNKTPLVVFDYDNKPNEFEEAIDLSIKNKFDIAYSNINFDYWLVLHKLDINKINYGQQTSNDAYVKLVKKVYGLDAREDIKNQKTILKILSQIKLEDIKHAIQCCYKIEENNKRDNSKRKITSQQNTYYLNPDFTVHLIVENILKTTLLK